MKTNVFKLIFAVLLSSVFAAQTWAEVAVIVHPSIADSASKKDISRIFLGKSKSLPGGQKVTPVSLAEGNSARDEFNDKVLSKSNSQLKSYWSKLVFTGKGQPPKELGSDADVVAAVSAEPGVIGYVSSASVTDGVKVLATF
ncbi:phosphate ABC transporter substrate-binding protein [Alkalimarinus sediminis]|uniref:Phosphate ABC transporter substrate-binding protein n=1 Tax=Alkalimarinus sediminis TaxID=1632866 RepID=A0A9E8KQ68_9ALTE|nr:phosphate ABC transporter substrate-binding protein [Alkalimarinus sediminis]UZW74885.1 phosphate ABC transporter substrate-binding protein [Alkalimarinus sediminis]